MVIRQALCMEAAPKKRSIAGLSQTSSARLMLFGALLIWQFLEVLAGAPAALVGDFINTITYSVDKFERVWHCGGKPRERFANAKKEPIPY